MEEVKKQKTKTSKRKRYMEKHYEKNVLDVEANNYLTHTKSTRGITLISLVVTIIVLLILAGVSINMALGDNGIFKKAKDSKTTMEQAVLKDKIETIKLNWEADRIIDSSIGIERLWEDLKNAGIIGKRSIKSRIEKPREDLYNRPKHEVLYFTPAIALFLKFKFLVSTFKI